jgi:hypothetical protein
MIKKRGGSGRHTEVETLSIAGTQMRIGPGFLITYADHFLLAAKSTQPPPSAPNFPLVRTFLACRAVELALKAFLSLSQKSLRELSRDPFGHDLKSLIEQAEEMHLDRHVELSDPDRDEIIRASTYYADKVLEYPALREAARAYPQMPDANLMIEIADKLVAGLRERCLAA